MTIKEAIDNHQYTLDQALELYNKLTTNEDINAFFNRKFVVNPEFKVVL